MAGSFSDYAEKKLLDLVFSATAFTAPATLYLALFTDTNTATQRDAGTVTEVSTGTWTIYTRESVTNNTTNCPAATGTLATKGNGTTISIPAATIPSGSVTVNAVGFYDAATAGNLIAWSDLGVAKTFTNGDTASLSANQFTITLD